jgi:hypothetical protein
VTRIPGILNATGYAVDIETTAIWAVGLMGKRGQVRQSSQLLPSLPPEARCGLISAPRNTRIHA